MKVAVCEDTDWLLSEEAYSIYAPCMYHPTCEDYKTQMEGFLQASSVKVFVCEDRNRKTGMMVLKFSEAAAEIIGIAVSEKLRRRGIGKQLILSAMELEGIGRIEAQTDDDSIGFYRRCGFSEEKSIIDYPDGSVVRYNCILNKQTNSRLRRELMNNKEIIKHFYEVVVSRNLLDELPCYVSEDCSHRTGNASTPIGIEGMRQHLIAIRKTYPDYTMKIIHQYEDGEYIVSEFIMTGTHKGEFIGITPTNKVIEIFGVDIDRIINGRIIEHCGADTTFDAFWNNGLIKPV